MGTFLIVPVSRSSPAPVLKPARYPNVHCGSTRRYIRLEAVFFQWILEWPVIPSLCSECWARVAPAALHHEGKRLPHNVFRGSEISIRSTFSDCNKHACVLGFWRCWPHSRLFLISGLSPPSLEPGGLCCPVVWTWPGVWVQSLSRCSCITTTGGLSWPCQALSARPSPLCVWCWWRTSQKTWAYPAWRQQPRKGRREVSEEDACPKVCRSHEVNSF